MDRLRLPVARRALACTLLSLVACGGETPAGETVERGGLAFEAPWARTSFPPHANAAAFLAVRDLDGDGDVLLGVATDAAAVGELHVMELVEEGGDQKMRMRQVERLEVPAGGALVLKPGAEHLMFFELARPWAAGETVQLRLRFERAGEVALEVPVREL